METKMEYYRIWIGKSMCALIQVFVTLPTYHKKKNKKKKQENKDRWEELVGDNPRGLKKWLDMVFLLITYINPHCKMKQHTV